MTTFYTVTMSNSGEFNIYVPRISFFITDALAKVRTWSLKEVSFDPR